MTSQAFMPAVAAALEGAELPERFVLPQDITVDETFCLRDLRSNQTHLRSLVQLLRTLGDLDPILLWQEIDAGGKATGRLVLLDGHHRLDAYASVKGRRALIPAKILNGDRSDALLAAIAANSRENLPLTKDERMNAAWQLVRLPGKRLSVPKVSKAAGVGTASVDRMRKRWRVMQIEGKTPSGVWWKDRRDNAPDIDDRPELTDAERLAEIERLSKAISEALERMPWKDEALAAQALQRAIGSHKLRSMMEYLYGEVDEFSEDADEMEKVMDALGGSVTTADEHQADDVGF
ncbi:hypothetical protein C8J27_108160 [Rhodobacter aestuarii]|uniref:ParB-like N-terminal domain-containing protein n=1 Tax=Rhodobacter aestuarii TaxID=453582 RepID=A0A1N7PGW5_9RHOB|nr:ParB/RepB/Spo0J family partition protein [Rhodobacter aestuarii]PTV94269.1 hypothetical protein C8J27_1081 [Rhodobacter aestuarii]PTV94423.1 hypothetical protein C8J27_108160 [Rhodobacter aestuarii]SIT09841.1 hypothetical protein SAMN05421580_1101 [Rhodobacter aestuarii]SIT12139.1 hypothetical protein SAMN05421580_110160 [Rhodobacter aestuarii]